MNYPLISEYIDSIRNAEDNFNELRHLRPVLDDRGNPIMSSGNFAVVFKMTDGKKNYAIKCFIKDQEGRTEAYKQIADELEFVSMPFLCQIKYYERELFVDAKNSTETEFPVLMMDWVEGITLDAYLLQNLHDEYTLQSLAYQFCRLGQWLLTQPFAHGDLKPDNILVQDDGSLVLVDYDGMYVPSMQGQRCREIGSPNYRHPMRNDDIFNEHIDDFAIASIALSLKAISQSPNLYTEFCTGDRLLFSDSDYRDLSASNSIAAIQPLLSDTELSKLYGIFLIAYSQQNLHSISFRLISLPKPEKLEEDLSTEVTKEDLDNAWTDEFGVKYSADRKRLLKGINRLTEYKVRKGTKVICNHAFLYCEALESVIIPDSVTKIGGLAFSGCGLLKNIIIPDSVKAIGPGAFYICTSLLNITLPNSVTKIGDIAFSYCNSLKTITIPNLVIEIGNYAFYECNSLESIYIPIGTREKFEKLLPDDKSKLVENIFVN